MDGRSSACADQSDGADRQISEFSRAGSFPHFFALEGGGRGRGVCQRAARVARRLVVETPYWADRHDVGRVRRTGERAQGAQGRRSGIRCLSEILAGRHREGSCTTWQAAPSSVHRPGACRRVRQRPARSGRADQARRDGCCSSDAARNATMRKSETETQEDMAG